jgi:hypothetical protein
MFATNPLEEKENPDRIRLVDRNEEGSVAVPAVLPSLRNNRAALTTLGNLIGRDGISKTKVWKK